MLLSNRQNLAPRLPSRAASCLERLLLWWHTHTERGACAHAQNTHTHTHTHTHNVHRYTRPHSCRLVLQTHTPAHTHTNAHTHVNCQERCLEREDPCHLLSRPASLLWLPNCQSPLSTTSHTEKQMSDCHFSEASDFKMVPFFSVHLRR